MNLEKRIAIRSKAIRKAAKGEECTVCDCNDGTTVFSHLDELWAGKGIGQKGDDIAGFFACHKCHYEYGLPSVGREIPEWMILRAMYRTIRRLWELDVIQIKP